MYGKNHDKETIKKFRQITKKRHKERDDYGFQKGNQIVKGNKWNVGNKYRLGKKHMEETKKKISVVQKSKEKGSEHYRKLGEKSLFQSREKHPSWKGGVSKYPNKWTNSLKEIIRKRDGYVCQLCGIQQDELKGKFSRLDVHHIDYNKYNIDPINLITLCRHCHIKTNYYRDYWEKYLKVEDNKK